MLAPHAADRAVARNAARRRSSAHDRCRSAEEPGGICARAHAHAGATLGPDISLAMLVVDNATGEVRARIGSPDYFDARRAGQVDMTQALRSPGSTLKPFIYGLGFEDGFIHPETLIDDRPTRYGGYTPQNFDFTFQGTVTVRRALQLSLNLPALAVLDQVGASRLAARLTQAGATLVLPEGEAPGPRHRSRRRRHQACPIWRCFMPASRGSAPPCRSTERKPEHQSRRRGRLMEPAAAWYVEQLLIGTPPPENGVAGPHRVQDRHQLRLPRRLVGRLRRQIHHRRLGRPARRRAGAGSGRPRAPPRRSCSMPSRGCRRRRRRCRRRRQVCC